MNLSTIQRKKQKLIGSQLSWVNLTGEQRKQYRALCAKERNILLKHPITPNRKVDKNELSPNNTSNVLHGR